MSGSSQNYKYRGIIPRAITQVFSEIRERFDQAITIRVSYAEIYNEMVNSYSFIIIILIYRCLICYLQLQQVNKMLKLCKSKMIQREEWSSKVSHSMFAIQKRKL
jgi:hypothetical protein